MDRSNTILEKLEAVAAEYDELVGLLSRGEGKSADFRNALKRIGEIEPLAKLQRELADVKSREDETGKMAARETDREMQDLAREELAALGEQRGRLLQTAHQLLFPANPDDAKNAIVEIRLGVGGEEAALFAHDLFRMYARYAEKKGFAIEIFNSHYSDLGGIKEIIFQAKGRNAYSAFKYESGVHRVQRIPATEASGRIHTSAATVAVFPDVEDEEITVDPKDLKMDTFCASGAGGQHVNKTASAVRITHIPTGLVVSCQDERSQLQNRIRAMKILKARLQYAQDTERKDRMDSERKLQVKTGERSEKIRTYNFPQNRVTDHRVGLTLYHLDRIMEGEMDELIAGMAKEEEKS